MPQMINIMLGDKALSVLTLYMITHKCTKERALQEILDIGFRKVSLG